MERKITPESLVDTLGARYATKAFDPSKKISSEDWAALVESLRLAPSSYGLQPWKFIVVQNPEIRTKLRAASWNQSQVEDASHFVVIATLKNLDVAYVEKYIESTAEVRGLTPDMLAGYRDMMVGNVVNGKSDHHAWAQRQSYIAMGFLGLSAGLMGIDTCMMEGISPADYDTILGLEGSVYSTVAAVAVGYRSAEDKTASYAKSRFALDEVVEVR